jgi:DNA-binding response OmpR family regulator
MAHIMVVEDEQELARLISTALQGGGHTVEVFRDGQFALDRINDTSRPEPDLYILDLGLPRVDGLSLTRRIRQSRITPILMLTAKTSELDKVLGLELGADDYITKPVSLRELQARVGAILRRVEMMASSGRTTNEQEQKAVELEGLRVDPLGRDVFFRDTHIALTAREFDLLYLLASYPGRVFSRTYLLDTLWGDTYGGFERTVDTHIQRLRRKLGAAGNLDERIVTLWGVGYKYDRRDS